MNDLRQAIAAFFLLLALILGVTHFTVEPMALLAPPDINLTCALLFLAFSAGMFLWARLQP